MLLVHVPANIAAIIRRLNHDAVAGSTTAARELRAWLCWTGRGAVARVRRVGEVFRYRTLASRSLMQDRSVALGDPDWDARFAGEDYLFGTEPNRFLVACRSLLAKQSRVLCVADGEGRNSVWLAAQGFDVDAFDPSPVGVGKARRLAAEHGVSVRFDIADANDWDWPTEAYDAVAAIFIQFAPPGLRRRIFSRIATTLRPGGLLLLHGYRVEQLDYRTGGPPVAEHLYTEAQLRAELSLFTIERLDSYDAILEEGAGHSGISALLDVVARRPPDPTGTQPRTIGEPSERG